MTYVVCCVCVYVPMHSTEHSKLMNRWLNGMFKLMWKKPWQNRPEQHLNPALISKHSTIKCGILCLYVTYSHDDDDDNVQWVSVSVSRLHPSKEFRIFLSSLRENISNFSFFPSDLDIYHILYMYVYMSNMSTKGIFKFKFSFRAFSLSLLVF